MRVLYRFDGADGHWAEIRDRKVTQFNSVEVLVFVDGSLVVSQLFHDSREAEYVDALQTRVKELTDDGWTRSAAAQDAMN
jgi:hypothetical protein